ncbi:hypothetical protein BJ508DRAFT_414191 [Ascobolus immersus RN42]|uniref:Uncharacterized protein n=1 Tax=Ascobolus immersus RN42 TaxID=1160509 RepID=A0A3N4I8F0_ASCIM|nr:hypothetical protein BJ508DRAFT_414191 [Ascobolus immersus RN42]
MSTQVALPEPVEAAEKTTKVIQKKTGLPRDYIHPFLFIISHLALQAIGTTLLAPYIVKDPFTLLSFPDDRNKFWGWFSLIVIKLAEPLGIWFSGLEATDATLLLTLAQTPTTHFLTTFFPSLAYTAHAITAARDIASITLPLYLLRPIQRRHHHTHHKSHVSETDNQTLISTTLLSSSLLTLFTYILQPLFLTSWAVTRFLNIESIERAKSQQPLELFSVMLPGAIGLVKTVFLPELVQNLSSKRKVGKKDVADIAKRVGAIAGWVGIRTVAGLGGGEGGVGVATVWTLVVAVVGGVLSWVAEV